MKNERLLAYVLVAVGIITLLSRLGGADWLWVGVVALVFLAGYVSRDNYGFLVAGSILMGVAVGLIFPTQAGMLLSLAVGFFVIDRIEPRPNRWPLYIAGILAILGAVSALSILGLLGTVGFALLLIAAGVYLIVRDRRGASGTTASTPASSTWEGSSNRSARAGGVEGNTYPPSSSASSVPTPTPTPPASSAPAPSTSPPSTSPSQPAPQTPGASSPPAAAPKSTESTDPATTVAADTYTATGKDASPELAPDVAEPALNPEAKERYRRLELWRRETAAAEGTPAYIVFRNETLERLAQRNPQTLPEVGEVKGIGPVKLERYGDAVLRVLRGDVPAQG